MSDPTAAQLELCRAHRAALTRQLAMAPDSLHRVLRCTRCGAWSHDTRAYEGFLRLADGGARPCVDLAELLAFASSQHRALHRVDRLDPCRCGAPAVTLSLEAARLFHAMPGSGAELVVELSYARDRVTAVRVGRAPAGGPVAFLESPDDDAVHRAFGVPLAVWPLWRAALAAPEGAVAPVEEGQSLAAFAATADDLRRGFEAALATDPDLRAYALTPRVASDPAWRWLRDDPGVAARPDTALVMLLRHDVLAARVALVAAGRGINARREGDTVWLEDGLARWPVELPVVAEEGLRHGFTLSCMAAAAVTHAGARLETMRSYFDAVEQLRPGVSMTAEGMHLTLTREGRAGRPVDLRVAPFGLAPDPETLDRDLRFHLDEAPPWSDPWRVCPCGAARAVSVRRWPASSLDEVGHARDELLRLDAAPDEAGTVRLVAVACDRHTDHGVARLQRSHPRPLEALLADAARDRDRARFTLRVAHHRDDGGALAALVEGDGLLDVTCDPGLTAGLAATVLGAGRAARVRVLSRALAVVAEPEADAALVARLEEAARVLWTLTRGAAPTEARVTCEVVAGALPAGDFRVVEGESPVASAAEV